LDLGAQGRAAVAIGCLRSTRRSRDSGWRAPQRAAMSMLAHWKRLRWATRRLKLPVPKSALVLEIGSGHNPYPRSDILVDGSQEDDERQGPLLVDRPLILSRGENLPFDTRVFDFVVASHVLEHSSEPVQFIQEMTRVGRAGYVEVPAGIRERIDPGPCHRLAIFVADNALVIYKKSAPVDDPYLRDAFFACWRGSGGYARFAAQFPEAFSQGLHWRDTIRYRVLNPHVDSSWDVPQEIVDARRHVAERDRVMRTLRRFARTLLRSSAPCPPLTTLLRCPVCRRSPLAEDPSGFWCAPCDRRYPKLPSGAIDMRIPRASYASSRCSSGVAGQGAG
jgi:hypothetical protein